MHVLFFANLQEIRECAGVVVTTQAHHHACLNVYIKTNSIFSPFILDKCVI